MNNSNNLFDDSQFGVFEKIEDPQKKYFDRVVTEHERKFRTLCRNVCRVALIICIAIMAAYFHKASILWWWVVPAFLMNGLIENYMAKENDNEQ
jgi:fatty acid desaturase